MSVAAGAAALRRSAVWRSLGVRNLAVVSVLAFGAPAMAQAPVGTPVTPPAVAAPPPAVIPAPVTVSPVRPVAPPAAIAVTLATPVEAAVARLVAAIDASPDWEADYQSVTVTGNRAVLTGLVLAVAGGGPFRAEFEPITIDGYSEDAAGFAIAGISAAGALVVGENLELELGAISVENLAFPIGPAIAFDPARPFTSMVKAYALIAKASVARAAIADITLTQVVSGLSSVITYEGLELAGVANGRIESMTTGPVSMSAPYARDEVVSYVIDGITTTGFDINALVHVFDPDQYVGGRGDREWRQVLAEGRYGNLQMDIPGASFRMGSFTVEDMKMRQSRESFAPLLDQLMANPDMPPSQADALFQRHIVDLMSAFSIGRIGLTGLDVAASGVDRFHIGAFHLSELSIDGLGEMGVEDVDVVVGGQVSLQLDRFAFGGLRLPSEDSIRTMIAAAAGGFEPNPLSLIPLLGFVEAAGLRVALPGEPPLSLDRASLKLDGYIGPIPTAIDFDLGGLTVPASLAEGMGFERLLAELGYRSFTMEQRVHILWREDTETVEVKDLYFGITDVGEVSVSFGLQGVSRAAIEHPERLEAALQSVMFTGATIRVTNSTLADRLIAYQARRANVTPEQYREQIANAIPFFIAILRNAAFQGRIAPALQSFIRAPGTMVVTMTPLAPVAFSRILETGTNAPQNLPDLLAIDVEVE